MTDTIDDLAPQPRSLEFVCDRCLHAQKGNDMQPIPRCPRCGIKLTPDDLTIPRNSPSLLRPQIGRRKSVGE